MRWLQNMDGIRTTINSPETQKTVIHIICFEHFSHHQVHKNTGLCKTKENLPCNKNSSFTSDRSLNQGFYKDSYIFSSITCIITAQLQTKVADS